MKIEHDVVELNSCDIKNSNKRFAYNIINECYLFFINIRINSNRLRIIVNQKSHNCYRVDLITSQYEIYF